MRRLLYFALVAALLPGAAFAEGDEPLPFLSAELSVGLGKHSQRLHLFVGGRVLPAPETLGGAFVTLGYELDVVLNDDDTAGPPVGGAVLLRLGATTTDDADDYVSRWFPAFSAFVEGGWRHPTRAAPAAARLGVGLGAPVLVPVGLDLELPLPNLAAVTADIGDDAPEIRLGFGF
jgi:hypothetical protein